MGPRAPEHGLSHEIRDLLTFYNLKAVSRQYTAGEVPKCLTPPVPVHSCPRHPSSAMGTGQTGSAARKGDSSATCRAAALGKGREEKASFSLNPLAINPENVLCTFGQKA